MRELLRLWQRVHRHRCGQRQQELLIRSRQARPCMPSLLDYLANIFRVGGQDQWLGIART
ncbi:hypothetical protein EMIT0P43_210018 [Pseudomonas jessenii]